MNMWRIESRVHVTIRAAAPESRSASDMDKIEEASYVLMTVIELIAVDKYQGRPGAALHLAYITAAHCLQASGADV